MTPETAAFQASRRPSSRLAGKSHPNTTNKKEEHGTTKGAMGKMMIDGVHIATKQDVLLMGALKLWDIQNGGRRNIGCQLGKKPQPCAAVAVPDTNNLVFTKKEHAQLLQIIKARGKTNQVPTPPMANMTGLTLEEPDWDG